MGKGDHIGEFEHKVLIAVLSLRGDAYGMRIRRALRESSDRDVSIGSVYATLDRLEDKSGVTSWEGDPIVTGADGRMYRVDPTDLGANPPVATQATIL